MVCDAEDPARPARIASLDRNCGYRKERGSGDKPAEWVKRGLGHGLDVVAYDNRNVKQNGKPVVNATGGRISAFASHDRAPAEGHRSVGVGSRRLHAVPGAGRPRGYPSPSQSAGQDSPNRFGGGDERVHSYDDDGNGVRGTRGAVQGTGHVHPSVAYGNAGKRKNEKARKRKTSGDGVHSRPHRRCIPDTALRTCFSLFRFFAFSLFRRCVMQRRNTCNASRRGDRRERIVAFPACRPKRRRRVWVVNESACRSADGGGRRFRGGPWPCPTTRPTRGPDGRGRARRCGPPARGSRPASARCPAPWRP